MRIFTEKLPRESGACLVEFPHRLNRSRHGAEFPGDRPPARRQLADEPVRLQRIGEPRLCPALLDAGFDRARIDLLAIFIEERQLAAGLVEAAAQPAALDDRRSGFAGFA